MEKQVEAVCRGKSLDFMWANLIILNTMFLMLKSEKHTLMHILTSSV